MESTKLKNNYTTASSNFNGAPPQANGLPSALGGGSHQESRGSGASLQTNKNLQRILAAYAANNSNGASSSSDQNPFSHIQNQKRSEVTGARMTHHQTHATAQSQAQNAARNEVILSKIQSQGGLTHQSSQQFPPPPSEQFQSQNNHNSVVTFERSNQETSKIHQNSKTSGINSIVPSSQVVTMNRRPKINDHNIKLIEKVIKRQNLTAQQDSRAHHMSSLLQQINSYDSSSPNVEEDGCKNSKSPQLIIKNSHYSSVKTPGQPQKLVLTSNEEDQMAMMVPASNYISDRIEKTLQKYQKKDVVKGTGGYLSGPSSGGPATLVKGSRNVGLYGNSGGSVNSISHVSKIYSSISKGGPGFSKQQNSQTSLTNQNSQNSPYLNGGQTIYNQKSFTKPQSRQVQQQQNNQLPLNLDQLEQFREVNSYSVDRVGNVGTTFSSAMKPQNQKDTDKRLTELSFDSLNPTNNSFTLGQHPTYKEPGMPPPNPQVLINNFGPLTKNVLGTNQEYPTQSKLKIKNKFQKHSEEASNKKHYDINSYEETPQQMKQSQSSSSYQQLIQQSPILHPMFTNGSTSNSYGYNGYSNNGVGVQDLFFDDVTQSTNDSGGIPNQQYWSQQMLYQHQQQQAQIKQALTSMYDQSTPTPGGVYTLSSNSNQKVQMSPMQYQPQMQYSKSRDGGYRNIPTRDLSSISDQSPSSNLHDNQHPGSCLEEHPFKRPKLHLFKKDASRRIKTSSATRNLQPIYPLEVINGGVFQNNKLFSNNFNSIHISGGGGTTTSSNQPGLIPSGVSQEPQMCYNANYYLKTNGANFSKSFTDQENKFQTAVKQNNLPQSQLQIRKINPFSTNHYASNISDVCHAATIDAGSSDDNDLGVRLSALSSIPEPDTVVIHRQSQTAKLFPRNSAPVIEVVDASNHENKQSQDPPKKNLNQEINGFKHSFYVDKNNLTVPSEPSKLKKSQEYEKDGVKHIFVLNVNAANNSLQIQESKAMTPCFLHTPNMTNKWNDFKASTFNETEGSGKLLINHQANPSQQSDMQLSNADDDTKPERPLFVRSKVNQNQSDLLSNVEVIQAKKPNTSHQTSKGDKKQPHILYKGSDCTIKLCPQDIYLQSNTTATAKGTKPSTSGSSFRRPLSRNHPMLNLVSKLSTDGIQSGGNPLVKLNVRLQSKTMLQKHKSQNSSNQMHAIEGAS